MIRTQLKWVAIGQVANLVLPVLLFPLLAQRLGVQGFAVFAVLTGLSQYSTLAVELGLNHVGLARMNNAAAQADKVRTFSSVQAVKLLLALGVLVILSGVVAWRSPVPGVGLGTVVALCAGSILTCLVYPAWFFTLIQRQDINVQISTLSRLGLAVGVLWGVHSEADVVVAVALFNFAFVPLALLHARHWIGYLRLAGAFDAPSLRATFRAGVSMSGAMVRETVTSLGIAPIYGFFAGTHDVGVFAFAEKLAKIAVLPAPIVASIALVHRERLLAAPVLQRLRRGDVMLWGGLLAAAVLAVVLYGGTAIAVVERAFPAYHAAVPMIGMLVLCFPLVYGNYLLVAVLHTGRENFSLVGRLSYGYVLLLAALSAVLGGLWGGMGLAVALGVAELLLFAALLGTGRAVAGDGRARPDEKVSQ
jgi:O-antigen/teichoic acid export membrane protein